ncbi:thioredoxin-2 [Colletes gigas]|uniref:thioredoxin-2 n=1 Tax=Colletes gigas TaxID=935657 RepID=UPI001C9AA2E3|nr:thioredoxin-2 [Colletes gigas]
MAVYVDDATTLESELTKAGDKLVVLDFFALWCNPCKAIAPKITELLKEIPDIVFLKIDVDEAHEIAQQYQITSMPTFVFIKNGKVLETFSGANYDKLKSLVLKHK